MRYGTCMPAEIIDFGSIPEGSGIERTPLRLEDLDTPKAPRIDPALLEAAKATFVATGGNIAEVARQHDLDPSAVTRLAATHDWPVYGHGVAHSDKARKTKLERLGNLLEAQVLGMAASLGVEEKDIEDFAEKGKGSAFVATLSQRSSAFSALFDRYMRVMTLIHPEVFGADDDPSNSAAAKLRRKAHNDALGGVDGINRQMADFAARLAVGVMDEMRSREATVIDVEATDG